MITIHHFNGKDCDLWDRFVLSSNNGTIFHTQKFLAYHKDKFSSNKKHLIFKKGETIIALLPLGFFEEGDKKFAKSPFGASWGGFVFFKTIGIKYIDEIIKVFINYLKSQEINEVIITLSPSCYQYKVNFLLDFGLISNGFHLSNYELSHVIEIDLNIDKVFNLYDSKCRNQIRKGLNNFTISRFCSVSEFYSVLLEDKERHNDVPTHSMEELEYLNKVFPNEIFFCLATARTGEKAGVCYFVCNNNCISTFYLCQQNSALGMNGLNALIHDGILYAIEQGYNFFDFGGSSVNGKIENFGVSQFKESFGAVGQLRRKYILNL